MGFRFPLAAVLRLREIVEEREERALTDILRQMAQSREKIAELDRAMGLTITGREQAVSSPLAAAEIQAYYRRLEGLEAMRAAQESALVELEQRRLQQLAAYHQAHRERRMLTDMKTDQRAGYDAGRSRAEQKTADELYLSRRSLK